MIKKKRKFLWVACLVLIMAVVGGFFLAYNLTMQTKIVVAESKVIGSGGYGAATNALIDPFDEKTLVFSCDMGSFYYSRDGGETYSRHNILGSIYTIAFDPTKEGVLWAGGSGVYKSTDHGETVTRVFPSVEDTTSEGNNYENGNNWIYSSTDYKPSYQIWSLCINRKDSDNVFVAQRVNNDGIYIYRTTNGEDFSYFVKLDYAYNFKLIYDESYDYLICATTEKIYIVNMDGETVQTRTDLPIILHHSGANILAIDSYYNQITGKNTFALSKNESGTNYESILYVTDDLTKDESEFTNLTAKLLDLQLSDILTKSENYKVDLSFDANQYMESVTKNDEKTYVKQTYPWKICNISILNDNVIYFYHEETINVLDEDGETIGKTRRTMAYIKYDASKDEKKQFKYVYGLPHNFTSGIVNLSWQDGDSGYCYGLSSTPQNENALYFSTIVGVYYTSDGENIYQQNSNVLETGITLTATRKDGETIEIKDLKRTTTTGVDVYCTHKVVTDPFDSNHLLMGCTDFGLLMSYDGGESWIRLLREWNGDNVQYISSDYRNTCYDLHFDKVKQGVVYSIWSNIQTAPYNTSKATTANGKFAVSYDGGISWTFSDIVSDGTVLPYRMQVEYNGDERTIYLATYSDGFFVSYDSGKTFQELNDGVTSSERADGIFGNEILDCEMGLFAITGGLAHNDGLESGDRDDKKLYKFNETTNQFESITLPTEMGCPRDIEYDKKNKCLYIACIANSTNIWTNLVHVGGGVWKYDGQSFTQICDEAVSMFGVNIDSSGRLYATSRTGTIYIFTNNNSKYEVLIDGLFTCLKNICFGANDNILYVTSWGGGTIKLTLKEVKI